MDPDVDTAPVSPLALPSRFAHLELWHELSSTAWELQRLPLEIDLEGLVLRISEQNGQLLYQSPQGCGRLREGESFCVGGHTLRVQSIPMPATLHGYSQPHRGRVWSVGLQEKTRLGRTGKRHNEVCLDDPTISRSHACIQRHSEAFILEVETSGSPTLINGERLALGQQVPLRDGDLIGLGGSLFGFQAPRQEANPTQAGLKLFTLGAFEAQWQGKAIVSGQWRSHLARFLLAYLALHWPRPVALESLLEVFWPEMEPDRSRNNLKSTLSSLRTMLKLPEGQNLFQRTTHTLEFHPELPFWHDLSQLRSLLQQTRSNSIQEGLRKSHQALELYRGSFLPDCYLDFAVSAREELEQELIGVGCRLIDHYRELAEHDLVLEYGRRTLALDPCCQEAYRSMMEASRLAGRPEESLRIYETCKRRLAQDMALEPNLEVERELQWARLNLG